MVLKSVTVKDTTASTVPTAPSYLELLVAGYENCLICGLKSVAAKATTASTVPTPLIRSIPY